MKRCRWNEALVTLVGIVFLGSACVDAVKFTPPPPANSIPAVPQLRLPPNDSYQGSVVTGKLQPKFAWEPVLAADGEVRYELQYAPNSEFSAEVVTIQTSALGYQPTDPMTVSSVPPVGRQYFWRARACVGDICSDYSTAWWVNLGRSAKDFNGDGYDDVIVGSHTSLDEANRPGRVYVYLGGPGSTFNSIADVTLADQAGETWFGYSVSSAGDFNGDGFADLIVGAPKSDLMGNDSGAAYLYFGGEGADFDTIADLVLRGPAAENWFGGSVASAGDVNGDGYSDVVVGAPDQTSDERLGRAYVYLGGKASSGAIAPDAVLAGSIPGMNFGADVNGPGDIDGDGYADILVGASSYLSVDASERCTVELFLGGVGDGFDNVKDGEVTGTAGEMCSLKAVGAGDVNGDGFADIIAKISLRSEGARLFLGGKGLIGSADMIFNLASGHSCREASSVGDLNGDGADDVAFVDKISTNSAQIFVHFGKIGAASSALSTSPVATIVGGGSTSLFFGWVVRGAGDVNGDGYDDLITGDQSENNSAGIARLYFGSGGGALDVSADGVLQTGISVSYFGYSVAAR